MDWRRRLGLFRVVSQQPVDSRLFAGVYTTCEYATVWHQAFSDWRRYGLRVALHNLAIMLRDE